MLVRAAYLVLVTNLDREQNSDRIALTRVVREHHTQEKIHPSKKYLNINNHELNCKYFG